MEWISVKERLPELLVLVLSTDGTLVTTTSLHYTDRAKEYYWLYFSSGCGCCDGAMENVTHWMPLPEPPSKICYRCRHPLEIYEKCKNCLLDKVCD